MSPLPSSLPSLLFAFIQILWDDANKKHFTLHASCYRRRSCIIIPSEDRSALQKGKKGHASERASCIHCDSRRNLNFRSFPTPSWTLDSTRRDARFISEKASDCHLDLARSLSLSLSLRKLTRWRRKFNLLTPRALRIRQMLRCRVFPSPLRPPALPSPSQSLYEC